MEEEAFQQFSKGTYSDVALMYRRTFGRRIDDAFEKKLCSIKNELQVTTHVCTAADVWFTSTQSFMGVTAHRIDFDLLERNLEF